MFSVIAEPFDVDAIVGIDDAIYYILASVCLSLGISIAFNNPNTGEVLIDLWNNLSDKARSFITNIKPQADFMFSFVFEWPADQWEIVSTEIINYFNNHSFTVSDLWVSCTPGSSGRLGFTDDSIFTFDLSGDTVVNEFNVVLLQSGRIKLGQFSNDVVLEHYPEIYYNSDNSYDCGLVVVENQDSSFMWVGCYHDYLTDSYRFSPGSYRSEICSPLNHVLRINGRYPFTILSAPSRYFNTGFYDSNNNFYYLGEKSNNKYAFISTYGNTTYQNLEFDSYDDGIIWFCDQVGLVVDFGDGLNNKTDVGVYDPSIPSDGVGVSYNPENTQQKLEDLNGVIDSTGSLPMVIPGNAADIGVLADNPALITDPAAAGEVLNIYPADLPQINSPSALWTDKFPFCLPFDIYNLFATFAAEPEIPKFHVLVLPKNSFGFNNEDIYFDIDFEPYDKLVKILRFFLSAAFVVFIILITRKLIGS